MRKSKLQLKIWQATQKRKWERQANNRRAAWNRIGKRFGLSREEILCAKKADLNPYPVVRNRALTRDAVRSYISHGHMPGEREYDWADYAIDMEIARAQHSGDESADFFDWFD